MTCWHPQIVDSSTEEMHSNGDADRSNGDDSNAKGGRARQETLTGVSDEEGMARLSVETRKAWPGCRWRRGRHGPAVGGDEGISFPHDCIAIELYST
jgi:hypothetical protein